MHCFVKGCRSNSIRTKKPGVSFHSIPQGLKSQWLSAIGRDPDIFIIQQRICSEHFDDGDFVKSGLHKRLKAGVIPTLNLTYDYDSLQNKIIADSMPSEQSEIIMIELERPLSPEEIHDNVFPIEKIEKPIASSPLIIISDSDTVSSDEESVSGNSTSAETELEVVVKGDITAKQVSDDSSNLPERLHFPPGTSCVSSSNERSYINPLHYLKRLKQEQERATLFRNKYKSALKTGNRRKKKILYLTTALDDLKKKIKQSIDASKPD